MRRGGVIQALWWRVTTCVPTHRATTIQLRTALFRDAAAIVETEYSADLSLDDIARRIASSRRQLQRAFAEIGNTTFRDHLTRVRMRRAAEMLVTRALTVREVANRVGYRQPAQFAKAFRREHGVSPSDYRATRRYTHSVERFDGARLGTSGALSEPFASRRYAA
jgi:AraC family transcriptional regulator, regulatory protein of adaptative response / methylphosphotriester-DNA alkyltransferase methyltransferase